MSELEPTLTNSNLTVTERLRAMLDERGVEWNAIDGDDICFTEWRTHGGAFVYTARESFRSYRDNDLRVETCGIPRSCLIATPEQAIAATLGATDARPTQAESSGTCRIKPWKVERDTGFFDCMECSECGYVTDVSDWAKWHFCPMCGRRIEQ